MRIPISRERKKLLSCIQDAPSHKQVKNQKEKRKKEKKSKGKTDTKSIGERIMCS